MRKNSIVFVLFFIVMSSFIKSNKCDLIAEFKRTEFKIVTDTANIPNIIKQIFVKRLQKRFFLANPGEVYNNTDMISEELPNERLIFSGYKKNKELFVLYFEKGGTTGASNELLIIKKKNRQIFVLQNSMFASDLKNTIQELKKITSCRESKLFVYKIN